MLEKDGFAKVVVEKDTGKILGFQIIRPYAPILIQEVINAMTSGGQVEEIQEGMHIHPALSELILHTLIDLKE
jgi:pyruvate/2-oxoglutarate dehydrogenase complex dihydrolipoamide dehydrogenase (E3) component